MIERKYTMDDVRREAGFVDVGGLSEMTERLESLRIVAADSVCGVPIKPVGWLSCKSYFAAQANLEKASD